MFKKLLLPLDLTDRHQVVLDLAAEMAQKSQGEVTLLHVVEDIPGLSFDEEKSFFQNLERTAQGHLRRLSKTLTDRQVTVRDRDHMTQDRVPIDALVAYLQERLP